MLRRRALMVISLTQDEGDSGEIQKGSALLPRFHGFGF